MGFVAISLWVSLGLPQSLWERLIYIINESRQLINTHLPFSKTEHLSFGFLSSRPPLSPASLFNESDRLRLRGRLHLHTCTERPPSFSLPIKLCWKMWARSGLEACLKGTDCVRFLCTDLPAEVWSGKRKPKLDLRVWLWFGSSLRLTRVFHKPVNPSVDLIIAVDVKHYKCRVPDASNCHSDRNTSVCNALTACYINLTKVKLQTAARWLNG